MNSSTQIKTKSDPFEGMMSPKELLIKYPKAKEVKNKRGKPLSFLDVGSLVNWGIIDGVAFPHGGCQVAEQSFIQFIESRGIELTETPNPF